MIKHDHLLSYCRQKQCRENMVIDDNSSLQVLCCSDAIIDTTKIGNVHLPSVEPNCWKYIVILRGGDKPVSLSFKFFSLNKISSRNQISTKCVNAKTKVKIQT